MVVSVRRAFYRRDSNTVQIATRVLFRSFASLLGRPVPADFVAKVCCKGWVVGLPSLSRALKRCPNAFCALRRYAMQTSWASGGRATSDANCRGFCSTATQNELTLRHGLICRNLLAPRAPRSRGMSERKIVMRFAHASLFP